MSTLRTIAVAKMATSLLSSPNTAPYFAALQKAGKVSVADAGVMLAEEIMAAAEACAAKAQELQAALEGKEQYHDQGNGTNHKLKDCSPSCALGDACKLTY